MTQPNEQLIETIEKALEAATPVPLHADKEEWPGNELLTHWVGDHEDGIGAFIRYEDAYLAANAPEWLRALLEERERWKDEALLQARLYTAKNNELQQTREELETATYERDEALERSVKRKYEAEQANRDKKTALQSHYYLESQLSAKDIELEQVKAERECLRSALEDVADYQHRWSDSPIREVQKIARSILSQYKGESTRENK